MGCNPSKEAGGTTFGNAVHVGCEGNVDLSGRNLSVLGPNTVHLITTDNLHRTATSLTLSNNKLYTLGKEVAMLENLEAIDMSENAFQRIPEVLAELVRLRRLSANSNPLNAENGFFVLPRLTQLRSLSVAECNLLTFPSQILQCANLEELDISGNIAIKLSGVALSSLKRLSVLSIANCGFSGDSLPKPVRNIKQLTSLNIASNSFTFNDNNFWGPHIPLTLTELNLSNMNLKAVPQVTIALKKLNSIDLSGNPIETLDVLAGRVMRRTISGKQSSAGSLANMDAGGSASAASPAVAAADEKSSVGSNGSARSYSSRVSMSKLSRMGTISTVSHPLRIKRLALRECNLRTVPKYFHKMTELEELDISGNESLDDPNMTLFTLQNLRKLSIVGCPFADDPSSSRNEWYDIAKLSSLRNLSWEVWKGNHNMSPYRTKIPIEICGLTLKRLNEIPLRSKLFVGDTIQTVINLLRDGYFKVDLAVDDSNFFSHLEAVKVFMTMRGFFEPPDIMPIGKQHSTTPDGATTPLLSGYDLGQLHLRISINRYIFFLAMQAANYDAVIVPPMDVIVMHYAQMTTNPSKYRLDCEAVCGRILNCNYRTFFIEQQRHPAEAKDAVAASKKIWNLMVRSSQRDLPWLRYDFWERRLRTSRPPAAASSSSAGAGGGPFTAHFGQVKLPDRPLGSTSDEILADYHVLNSIDSTRDLSGVLDQAITSYFQEQGVAGFKDCVSESFRVSELFVAKEEPIKEITLDWSRYVKYLALYAYRKRLVARAEGTFVMEPIAGEDGKLFSPLVNRQSSVLGKHYDAMEDSIVTSGTYLPMQPQQASSALVQRTGSQLVKRSYSAAAKSAASDVKWDDEALKTFKVDPIPTIGIMLLLHVHRTHHVKYFQTLALLGIEDVDIHWTESRDVIADTKKAWEALYEEAYVAEDKQGNAGYAFRCDKQGFLSPKVVVRGKVTDDNFASKVTRFEYKPMTPPLKSCLKKATAAAAAPEASTKNTSNKRVQLCCGDVEYGVF